VCTGIGIADLTVDGPQGAAAVASVATGSIVAIVR
jgi:hypothetical protein